MLTQWYADLAWLGADRAEPGILIETDGDRIRAVIRGVVAPPAGAVHLAGLTLPGLANAHSHAFHRALRGRVQRGAATFWSWREQMYAVAARLDPDSYYALARATYAEMALAGITCVGEFHYLHHRPGGRRYDDPNAMALALFAAAAEAGIRITLLDTCYLVAAAGSTAQALAGPQLRFGDGDAASWADRAAGLHQTNTARVGAAIHSVRAVPAADIDAVAGWASEHEAPLHFHLSEQAAENEACAAVYGCTPAALLAEHGALGAGSTAVHATHLTSDDVALLGGSGTTVCMCPTTEQDLADGVGPARLVAGAGAPLALGSDSHAVIDLLAEARALELHQRLASGVRGNWPAAQLLLAATAEGHACLGWPEAGRIEAGALADFVTVALDSVRTAGGDAGTALETAVFAATAADVRDVVVGGRRIVEGGRHTSIADVPAALRGAISPLFAPGR